MNNNSKIARPLSITSMIQASTTTSIRDKIANVYDYDKKSGLKRPTSRLSKSHSMHKLPIDVSHVDEKEEYNNRKYQQQHRRALLSRATTTPVPKPSSLIRKFSSDYTSVLVTSTKSTKNANATTRRSSSSTTTNTTTKSTSLIRSSSQSTQQDFRVGQRVIVPSLNTSGTVRFHGQLKFKGSDSGRWVGIELDIKGTGKNDGSVKGVQYFSCPPNTGLFVLSTKVKLENTVSKKPMLTQRSHNSIVPSKSARAISNRHSTQPLPTRSSPSIKKTSSPAVNKSKSTVTNPLVNKSTVNTSPTVNRSKSTAANAPTTPTPTHKSRPVLSHRSKSTVTETTLKKSASVSTAENACLHHHHGRKMRESMSTKTTKNEVDELERISALLEISRKEQKALTQQIDGKEAAWERLLSAKESYAVRVQEKDDEIMRLKREFEQAKSANEQLLKLTSEKTSAISRAHMSEAMEKQHVKVIERLDTRVRSLQEQNAKLVLDHEVQLRDSAAQINQIRKQLAERDQMICSIERESAEIQHVGLESQRAYEKALLLIKKEHEQTVHSKDVQIQKLQLIVNDLSNPIPTDTLPIRDDTRSRLEAQLELSTKELDKERLTIENLVFDNDQLKEEIKRLHRMSATSNMQFYSIQDELKSEIKDKARIMEERNAALETQSRLEEENERIRLTHDKTQRDLADVLKKLAFMERQHQMPKEQETLLKRNQELELEYEKLLESQKQTEHECTRLLDELLAIEKVESGYEDTAQGDEKLYQREIEQLKLQVVREAKRYEDLEKSKYAKIEQLNKELSDMESLVEKKVFDEAELEETIENEKRKVRLLENRLQEEEDKAFHQRRILPPMSPTSPRYSSVFLINKKRSSTATASSFTMMTSSSLDTVSDHGDNMLESIYCEICEEYGHEVITCNAYSHIDESKHDTLPATAYYCVNCDIFNDHPTETCPNQDETF